MRKLLLGKNPQKGVTVSPNSPSLAGPDAVRLRYSAAASHSDADCNSVLVGQYPEVTSSYDRVGCWVGDGEAEGGGGGDGEADGGGGDGEAERGGGDGEAEGGGGVGAAVVHRQTM